MLKANKKRFMLVTLSCILAFSSVGCQRAPKETAPENDNKPKPELKALMPYANFGTTDYASDPVGKAIEEKTGYKVSYDMLPQDKPLDKLNLLVSSGEEYDFINISGSMLSAYYNYARQGALAEVQPLIDKFGPNIKSAVSEESFEGTLVNGKRFGIPAPKPAPNGIANSSGLLAIRQDWLDKLGLKVPKTLDELTLVLREFRDKDPGQNGVKNIPLLANANGFFGLGGAFGIPNGWEEKDGMLQYYLFSPAYLEKMAYLTELYKEGLMDKEFPTNTSAINKEKITSGKAGVFDAGWDVDSQILAPLNKNKPEAALTAIEPLTGKNGKSGIGMVTATSNYEYITVIPVVSRKAEDVIKYVNAKLEKDTFKYYYMGEEGKTFTYKDGTYSPILPDFFNEKTNAWLYLTGVDEKNYNKYWEARIQKDKDMYERFKVLNYDWKKYFVVAPNSGAPFMPEQSKNGQVLDSLVSDWQVKVVTGAAPLSSYDEMIKDWKLKGGDAIIKEMNDWYTSKAKK